MRGFTAVCTTAWTCEVRDGIRARDGSSNPRQIGARIAEIPIILWPDKRGARRSPHFRDGWAASGYAALRPELAIPAAGAPRSCWLDSFLCFGCFGPRQISQPRGTRPSPMIFGVIFTLLGAQILSIGAFQKYSAMRSALTAAPYLCGVF